MKTRVSLKYFVSYCRLKSVDKIIAFLSSSARDLKASKCNNFLKPFKDSRQLMDWKSKKINIRKCQYFSETPYENC